MGAWGTGLQASDAALDALGIFEKDLQNAVQGKVALPDLFRRVAEKLDDDETDGVLGVADALLDQGVDLSSVKEFILIRLEDALKPSSLGDWDDPGERVASLRRFERRLNGVAVDPADLARDNAPLGACPPKAARKASWKPEAEALRKDVARQLDAFRKEARSLIERARKDAEALAKGPAESRMEILNRLGELWDQALLEDADVREFVLIVMAAGWRFPPEPLLKFMNDYCLACTCPLLEPALGDPSPDVRRGAIDFIFRFDGRRYASVIAKRLNDSEGAVRAMAIRALRGHRKYSGDIAARLEDPYPEARKEAILAIAVNQLRQHLPRIEPLLKDPDADVRAAARSVLHRKNPGRT